MPRALDRSLGSEVYIYRHNQNVIGLVAVQPDVILGRQFLFSPQIESYVFIFCKNMTYCNKSIPFLLPLNYVLRRYLQRNKTGRAISYRDSRLPALRADRWLVKKMSDRQSGTPWVNDRA
jgi:hypothetical protein